MRRIGTLLGTLLRWGVFAFFLDRRDAKAYWRAVYRALAHPPSDGAVPIVALEDVTPKESAWAVSLYDHQTSPGGMPAAELLTVIAIAKARGAERVFEFGTYRGETAYQLAMNGVQSVWTLDLPVTGAREVRDSDLDVYPERPGSRFLGLDAERNIELILQDSMAFDTSLLRRSMDLVIVDAAHDAEHVRNDSEKAMELVRPGGAVLWHDFAPYAPGVMSTLRALAAEIGIVQIEGTSLALYADAT